MDIQEIVGLVRDLAIILFAMLGMLVMLTAAIVGLLLYRKVAPTLDSAKGDCEAYPGSDRSAIGQGD